MEGIAFAVFESSLGNILLVSRDGALIRLALSRRHPLEIVKEVRQDFPSGVSSSAPFKRVRTQLDRYLRGQKVHFSVAVDLSDLGEFTRKVLLETMRIPYGDMRSYLWIAGKVGAPQAPRAVGQALKRNPIPLIIPCHRVVKADGSLGGFSLEGISKADLLKLEGVSPIPPPARSYSLSGTPRGPGSRR